MANETTFSIKFDGYEKTFESIENVTFELTSMQNELKDLEKQLSSAKFGSKEWDNLNLQIKETETNIDSFSKEIAKSSKITNKALESTLKLQEEATKQSEETAKAFEDAFSPEQIVEFSAKASAAFIGLSEGFTGTGEAADKATERLNKAMVQVNGIKDTAEVAVMAFGKFKTALNSWSDSLAKGGAAAQVLSKGLKFLTTGLKGPFVLIGVITAAIGGLIASFGSLGNAINFVTDSLGGLMSGFKALVSGENPFTAYTNEVERAGKLRGFEKQLEAINQLQGDLDLINAKYQRYIDQSLTFAGTQALVNKQYDVQNKFIASQIKLQNDILSQTKDLGERQVLLQEIRAKEVQLVELLSAKEQKLKELELSRIDSVLEKQKLSDDIKRGAIQRELDLNTASTEIQIEGVTKLADFDIASTQRRITALQKFGALDETQTNEVFALKVQLKDQEIEKQKKINEAILNSGVVQRAIIEETNSIKITALEKELTLIDIRTQKGIDAADVTIQQIEDLKTTAINAELEKYSKISELGDTEKQRVKELQNELLQIEIDGQMQRLDVSLRNLQLIADAENINLDLRESNLEKISELQDSINTEDLRNINQLIEQNEKRLKSFKGILNQGKIYKEIIANTNKLFDEQQEIIEKEKTDLLNALQIEKDRLDLKIKSIEAQKEIRTLNSEELQQLDAMKTQLNELDGKEVKIKLDFQTKTGENENNRTNAVKEKQKEAVNAQIEEAQAIAQGLADVSNIIIDQQLQNLNNQLDLIAEKKSKIDEELGLLKTDLEESQKEILDITAQLEDAKGAQRGNLLRGLEAEIQSRDKIAIQIKAEEKQKKQLAKEEEKIREKQAKLMRTQIQIQAILTLAQSIGAIANAASQSGTGAIIIVPLVVAAIAAGFAAVASFQKMEKGGKLKGNSHSDGGIKGTGSFSNIEVEGGEFIVRKEVANQHPQFLEDLNAGRLKFADGGSLPSQAISTASSSILVAQKNQSNLESAISNLNLQIAVTDINSAQERVKKIELKTAI